MNLDMAKVETPLAAFRAGIADMMTSVHEDAVINSPKDTRALANSGRFVALGKNTWGVRFGNSRVDYAELRERENHKNPHTVRYLGRAFDKHTAMLDTYMTKAAKRMGF